MGRGNEVDVAYAVVLQAKHDAGKLLDGDIPAVALVADIVVLAENTAKITTRKKDSPAAPAPDKYRLLAKMRPSRCDTHIGPDTAAADLTGVTINTTLTRTHHTAAKHTHKFFHTGHNNNSTTFVEAYNIPKKEQIILAFADARR